MIFEKIHKFFTDTIAWLMFTNHCRYCNKLIGKDEFLCEDCKKNLPVISGERCKYCGAEKSRCNCRQHKNGFETITAPYYYENGIRKCIHLLKFSGKEFLVHNLAQDMAETVMTEYGNVKFDFVCYVPFSVTQRINRSYNQSELLALNLSEKINIPIEKALVKLFDTNAQHNMSYKQRTGNVFGIYDVADGVDVKGKTILLVDDVKTSGATLNECAWMLRIRGAEKVYCVVSALAGVKPKEK